MVILDAEFQFDRHKLTYFFEADARIDFRDLVSELFSLYKTRIWMQQVDTTTIPRPEDPEVQLAFASGLLPQTSLLSVLRTFAGALIPQESYAKMGAGTSMGGGRKTDDPYARTLADTTSTPLLYQGSSTPSMTSSSLHEESLRGGYRYQGREKSLHPWSYLDSFQG
jgi:hypothetical protein